VCSPYRAWRLASPYASEAPCYLPLRPPRLLFSCSVCATTAASCTSTPRGACPSPKRETIASAIGVVMPCATRKLTRWSAGMYWRAASSAASFCATSQGGIISACPILCRSLISSRGETYDSPDNRPQITEENHGPFLAYPPPVFSLPERPPHQPLQAPPAPRHPHHGSLCRHRRGGHFERHPRPCPPPPSTVPPPL